MAETLVLYTVILDFNGGTYISQVRAATPTLAAEQWAQTSIFEEALHRDLLRSDLEKIIKDSSLMPLSGLFNVWCISGITEADSSVLINLVATAN